MPVVEATALRDPKRLGVRIVALTGGRQSTLGRSADVVLDCSVSEEACPFDLAPTTSSTAALAMGDALAVALLETRGFTREDFARLHPGGSLGRKLTLRVRDVMIDDDYPRLGPDAPMRQCVMLLAEKRGTVPVVDGAGRGPREPRARARDAWDERGGRLGAQRRGLSPRSAGS